MKGKTENEIRLENESTQRILKIKKLAEELASVTNSSLVTYDEIAQAFGGIHSYLFNQLLLGMIKNLKYRKGDGRILPQLFEAYEKIWG